MYFNIKCTGKFLGLTNEFERYLVFETGEFERPKFDCSLSKYASVLFLKSVSMNGPDSYGYTKFMIQSGPHMGCRTSSLGHKELLSSESRDS